MCVPAIQIKKSNRKREEKKSIHAESEEILSWKSWVRERGHEKGSEFQFLRQLSKVSVLRNIVDIWCRNAEQSKCIVHIESVHSLMIVSLLLPSSSSQSSLMFFFLSSLSLLVLFISFAVLRSLWYNFNRFCLI